MIHRNSSLSYRQTRLGDRMALVFSCFRDSTAPLTDREVMERLGFQDMNMVRPSITKLIEKKKVVEIASVPDPVTKRTVRVCTNSVLA